MASIVIGKQVWRQATLGIRTPTAGSAAAERLGLRVRAGLSRWIGELGYDVLLNRSLHLMRRAHPAIESITSFIGDAGPPIAAQDPPAPAALESAVVTLLATMVDLLALMVGPQMAGNLLTLSCEGPGEGEGPIHRGTDD